MIIVSNQHSYLMHHLYILNAYLILHISICQLIIMSTSYDESLLIHSITISHLLSMHLYLVRSLSLNNLFDSLYSL
jgi:hypothetical protein